MDTEDRPDPGFYSEPKTELSEIAQDSIKDIYERLGIEVDGGVDTSQHNTKVIVFIMRLLNSDGTEATESEIGSDREDIAEDTAVSFGGYGSPAHMISHVLYELERMAAKAGLEMSVDEVRGSSGFSPN